MFIALLTVGSLMGYLIVGRIMVIIMAKIMGDDIDPENHDDRIAALVMMLIWPLLLIGLIVWGVGRGLMNFAAGGPKSKVKVETKTSRDRGDEDDHIAYQDY